MVVPADGTSAVTLSADELAHESRVDPTPGARRIRSSAERGRATRVWGTLEAIADSLRAPR